MIRALFVSDIHISSSADPKCGLFLKFLDRCAQLKPERLFLVGDIFDLWISDRSYFLTTYAEIVEKIKILKNLGVQIHYFEGNHDLDLKVFWEKQVGIQVHEEATYFELGARIFRVEHGDQMDPEDGGYLFLRWLLRTPILRALERYLPNPVVAWIGQRASHASRDYTTHSKTISPEQIRSKIQVHAGLVHAQRPFDVLVSGHVHVDEDREYSFGDARVRSVNLGTWLSSPRVLVLDQEQNLELLNLAELLN